MPISEEFSEKQPPSDEELVALAQRGSFDIVSVLLERFSPLVRVRVAAFSSYGVEPDDLVQEGMLGLLSAIYTYKEAQTASFRTYASVCINNRILSFLKKTSRQKRLPLLDCVDLDETIIDESPNPEDLVIAGEELAGLKKALISRLSQVEFYVITLFLAGYSYEEIAKRLGSTAKSVDNALQRVRRKLREADLS